MKTLRLLLLLLVVGFSPTAHGGDWRKELTPVRPGGFAPLLPFKAKYKFGWAAFTAAEAEFEYERKGGMGCLKVKAATIGAVRPLWRMDAEHRSVVNLRTLRPVSLDQVETYKKDKKTFDLDFNDEGVVRRIIIDPPDAEPAKEKKFEFPEVLEIHSALQFIRSQPLKPGDVMKFVVYPSSDPYLAEVTVLEPEKRKIAGQPVDTIKLDLKLQKIDKKLNLTAHKKFKRATAWLSADERRMPLRSEAEIFVGAVWTELQSIEWKAKE